jgi:hypothetical protein
MNPGLETLNHERSTLNQVAAVRLYTTCSYPVFNNPLRAKKSPHPL